MNINRTANMDRRSYAGLCLCAMIFWLPGFASAADPPAAVDRDAVLHASALFDAGRYVEAEPIFSKALAAMDAGTQPKSDVGRCVGPLAVIYRTWGRLDDALQMAERQRAFLEAARIDATVRDQLLEENAMQRVEILAGLTRFADAERVLQPILDNSRDSAADPLHRLALWTKSARLAEMQPDAAKTRQRWLKVIELGNALLARIAQRQLAAAKLPEVVATLVSANVALEDFAAAIELDRRLLATQSPTRDRAAAFKTQTEIVALERRMATTTPLAPALTICWFKSERYLRARSKKPICWAVWRPLSRFKVWLPKRSSIGAKRRPSMPPRCKKQIAIRRRPPP